MSLLFFHSDYEDVNNKVLKLMGKIERCFGTDNAPVFLKLYQKYFKECKKFMLSPTHINYIFIRAIKEEKHAITELIEQKFQPQEPAAIFWAVKMKNNSLAMRLGYRGMKDNLALEAAYKNNDLQMFEFLFGLGMRYREDGKRFNII